MNILIIGGDRRMVFAAKSLEKNGHKVSTLGLFTDDKGDIQSADIIILPVPVTRDKVNINCPLTGKKIPLEIIKTVPVNTLVFGGGKLSIDNYIDYLSLEEYAVKNAVITAEGAVSYALDNTDSSLWQSRILVIGYGKTGKAITERLSGFHPKLTVSARSERDFAALDTLGINNIKTSEIHTCKNGFDIVFNTVDIKFSDQTAKALSSALFIDVSTFGGFADGAAEKHNIKYKKLPSLPAACAPESAGKIIAETVINLQNKNGEKYA